MKPIVYLALPYSANMDKSQELSSTKPDYDTTKVKEERFKKANEVAAKLFKAGFWVISPISMTHPIAIEGNIKGTFSEWEKFNYFQISTCHMVFILCINGWDTSEGVAKEATFAQDNGIPVIKIDENLQILGD